MMHVETRLYFKVVHRFNGLNAYVMYPSFQLQNSVGETIAHQRFDFYYPITIKSSMYSQCQTDKLLIGCFFNAGTGECGGTVRIDGGVCSFSEIFCFTLLLLKMFPFYLSHRIAACNFVAICSTNNSTND